jgi:hypothetical protein
MYSNPRDYLDDEEEREEKKRQWCIHRAMDLAEKKATDEEKTEMDSEDIVEAAEKFLDFITQERDS